MTHDKARFQAAFGEFYDRAYAKYGDWHGFNTMILNSYLNNIAAITVGD